MCIRDSCAYCAVDCYGLISGYVGVNGKFRPARLLELWLQVFFYSFGLSLIHILTGEKTWRRKEEGLKGTGKQESA